MDVVRSKPGTPAGYSRQGRTEIAGRESENAARCGSERCDPRYSSMALLATGKYENERAGWGDKYALPVLARFGVSESNRNARRDK